MPEPLDPNHASNTEPVQLIHVQPASSEAVVISRYRHAQDKRFEEEIQDWVATEEPLEIRLAYSKAGQKQEQSISVTMRTPGDDIELALGFLLTEGLISSCADVHSAEHCGPGVPGKQLINVVKIALTPECDPEPGRLLRHFYTSSSCGVCGKTSIEALKVQSPYAIEPGRFFVSIPNLLALPQSLSNRQTTFQQTGGLHAAGLFTEAGEIIVVREDVGRHNAVDKLVGWASQQNLLPWRNFGVILSGRISFELVQKVAMAGGSLIVAIGPPSSLAIQAATDFCITLVGFLKADSFNVYGNATGIL